MTILQPQDSIFLGASADDWRLVEKLRAGDEEAFMALVQQYQNMLTRLALMYVSNREVAHEVVQETWLGVLQSIHRFEGRASLKTWLYRILTNCAKKRGVREDRYVPLATFADDESDDAPTVEPARFHAATHPQWPYHWATPPQDWDGSVEKRLLSQEAHELIQQTIKTLPDQQRAVITLRDIEGWSAAEVCNSLGISETNQRVLLHRARARVRRVLENYFAET
jgi:RNA polymerase sigma-70 factor (ECF subfamily)